MYSKDIIDRRRFMQGVTASTAAMSALLPESAWSAGSSDKLNLGFIGVGGRGQSLLGGFLEREDCHVSYLCDVNQQRLTQANKIVQESANGQVSLTSDLQEVLADNSIDAVVIATPDHWHSLATIRACQEGKHVYVEKPISKCIWEGRKAVEAARKYDRVVQSGMQNRSAPYNLHARDYIQDGKLGKVILCRVYNQKTVERFSLDPNSSPPDYLDWERWSGPCTTRQFNATRYKYWHQFWDYGGGEVANDGVHQLDLACMVLGIDRLPKSVYSLGTHREDMASETPDTMATTFDFGDFPMVFNQTLEGNYMLKSDSGIRSGDLIPYWPQNSTRVEIFGTKGVMFLGRHGGGWQVYGRPKSRKPVIVAQEFGRFPDPEHKQEFVRAIRTGKRPTADIGHGHRSAALCHFTNISYRVGNQLLEIDTDNETITNCPEGNELLRSSYRESYAVPEHV